MPVYTKTPKGVDAVEKRTPPLPLRARQVLIMIDGQRDTAMLSQMFPGDALHGVLESLLADGLIDAGSGGAAAVAPAASAAAPAGTAAATVGGVEDPHLAHARKLMVNLTQSFAGHVGGDLVRRLREASSVAALEALRTEWHKLVAQNPMALDHLRSVEKQLEKHFVPLR